MECHGLGVQLDALTTNELSSIVGSTPAKVNHLLSVLSTATTSYVRTRIIQNIVLMLVSKTIRKRRFRYSTFRLLVVIKFISLLLNKSLALATWSYSPSESNEK